jgi:membrane protease YdiL (CAAX protease family)
MKPFRFMAHAVFPRRMAQGVSQPPWSGRAAAVAVVSSFAGFLGLDNALDFLLPGGWGGAVWPSLVGHLPLLCALGYLTRRAGTSVERLFGLDCPRVGALLGSAIVLHVLESLLSVVAGVTLSSLGFGGGAGVSPEEARKVAGSFLLIDVVVWGPICEEFMCRGLLYTSLRTGFGIALSSVVTAAVFAWLHDPHSLTAAGTYFFPAILSSLWYERTRSLWPNVISHALHNLVVTLILA